MPDWNFFLTPSRVWELMIGAAAACTLVKWDVRSITPPFIGNLLGVLGLAMIAAAIFFIDDDPTLPGFATLLPTIGSALIILFAFPAGAATRFLSLTPLVTVGLVSYSAYLFHQPLFAFFRLYGPLEAGPVALLTILTFVLAYLSWRFVEQPFRHSRSPIGSALFRFAAGGAALLTAASATVLLTNGLPQRFPEPVYSYFVGADGLSAYRLSCNLARIRALAPDYPCHIGTTDSPPTIAFWGDSHTEALVSGLDRVLREKGLGAVVFDKGGCMPGFFIAPGGSPRYDRRCTDRNLQAINTILDTPGITDVVLTANWSIYASLSMRRTYDSAACKAGGDVGNLEQSLTEIACVISTAGKKLTIVRQTPPLPKSAVESTYDRATRSIDTATRHILFDRAAFLAKAENVAIDAVNRPHELFEPSDVLCGADSQCLYSDAGIPLYRDATHLSPKGSELVGRALIERHQLGVTD